MLCELCPVRRSCDSPCDAMLAEIGNLERYQREYPLPPKKITEILEKAQEESDAEPPMIYRSADDQITGADTEETIRRLREILPELATSQRLCLFLRFWKSLSLGEIAGVLEIDKKTVRIHLRRAFARIRRDLERAESREQGNIRQEKSEMSPEFTKMRGGNFPARPAPAVKSSSIGTPSPQFFNLTSEGSHYEAKALSPVRESLHRP